MGAVGSHVWVAGCGHGRARPAAWAAPAVVARGCGHVCPAWAVRPPRSARSQRVCSHPCPCPFPRWHLFPRPIPFPAPCPSSPRHSTASNPPPPLPHRVAVTLERTMSETGQRVRAEKSKEVKQTKDRAAAPRGAPAVTTAGGGPAPLSSCGVSLRWATTGRPTSAASHRQWLPVGCVPYRPADAWRVASGVAPPPPYQHA